MKRTLSIIIILLMMFSAFAKADVDDIFSAVMSDDFMLDNGEEDSLLEGPGFDTPEEAVLAYLEAWNNADLKGMLATFAIETWADRQDGWYLCERWRGFDPTLYVRGIPSKGDYLRNLRVTWRYGDLLYRIARQFNWYSVVNYIDDTSSTGSIAFRTGSDLDEFYRMWESSVPISWEGHVIFEGWLDPGALTDGKYYYAQNLRNSASQIATDVDCDDFVNIVAQLNLNGQHAALFMTCGQYGGRWYNLDLGGTIASILALDSNMQGLLIPESEMEWQALIRGTTIPADALEGKSMVEAHLHSGYLGTRWVLSAIDGNSTNYQVLSSRAELDNAETNNTAWGQLRFTRNAYIMQVRCNPIQSEALFGEPKLMTMTTGVWNATQDGIELYDRSGEKIPVMLRENMIVLTDRTTGLSYTFNAVSNQASVGAQRQRIGNISKLEGDGYSSPEAAVQAYIEAFNAGDTKAMLSTFAIETWAERSDGITVFERYRAINQTNVYDAIPVNSTYSLQMKIAGRYGRLNNRLASQYLDCAAPSDYPNEGYRYDLDNAEMLDKFWREWRNAPGTNWAGKVEFIGWIDLNKLSDYRLDKISQRRMLAVMTEVYGCDDITPVAAHIKVNGKNAVLLMDCGEYDGRWYNIEQAGTIGNLLSIWYASAGLIIDGSENWNSLPYGLTSSNNAQSDKVYAVNQQSGLVGTYWKLVKANGNTDNSITPVLYDSRDMIDYSGEDSLWGELRFTRAGCIVHLEQSEEYRNEMPLIEDGFSRAYYAWEPTYSGVRFSKSENTVFDVIIDGSKLSYTDPLTNMTYTYTRYK